MVLGAKNGYDAVGGMEKFLFVNFKAYPESTGENAVLLAKKIEKASKGSSAKTILVVQAVDLRLVSKAVSLDVFAQHFDSNPVGAFTGSQCIESLVAAGAKGSVLNHAEKKVPKEFAKNAAKRALDASFPVLMCADSLKEAFFLCSLYPKFIAFEPPKLIGGDISVSTAQPKLISDFVSLVKKSAPKSLPLVGAGVKNSFDVKKAIELGAAGVFVASGVVKAKSPQDAVEGLLSGFK